MEYGLSITDADRDRTMLILSEYFKDRDDLLLEVDSNFLEVSIAQNPETTLDKTQLDRRY